MQTRLVLLIIEQSVDAEINDLIVWPETAAQAAGPLAKTSAVGRQRGNHTEQTVGWQPLAKSAARATEIATVTGSPNITKEGQLMTELLPRPYRCKRPSFDIKVNRPSFDTGFTR